MVEQALVNGKTGFESGYVLVHGSQVEDQSLTWGGWCDAPARYPTILRVFLGD